MARKPTPGSKQQRTPSPLPEAEWNFERVAVVDLPACYLWEFWREKCHRDPAVAEALNNRRQDVCANDDLIRQHDRRNIALFQFVADTSPDLPEGYAESLKFHGEFNLYLWSTVNPLSTEMDGLANISEAYFPSRTFQSLDPVLRQIIRGNVIVPSSKGQLPLLVENPSAHKPEPNQQPKELESVSFKINWAHTDERIQEAFREWLILSRKDRKARLTRGLGPGKSVQKTLLKNLKALGALRLLTHHGSSTAAMGALKKISRQVFRRAAEWSKAKKHAESVLKDFKILAG